MDVEPISDAINIKNLFILAEILWLMIFKTSRFSKKSGVLRVFVGCSLSTGDNEPIQQ